MRQRAAWAAATAAAICTLPDCPPVSDGREGEKRATAPLFDSPRYAFYMDSAFLHMAQHAAQGLPPETFNVLAENI